MGRQAAEATHALAQPVEWLGTPKTLFGEEAPIRACQSEHGFRRAMLLHDLALGLDAPAEEVDMFIRAGILDHDDLDDLDQEDLIGAPGGGLRHLGASLVPHRKPRLFTAVIALRSNVRLTVMFLARKAGSAEDFRMHLCKRLGSAIATSARITEGFGPTDPVVAVVVSDSSAKLLTHVADNPEDVLGDGLDIHLEQRFAN